MEPNDFLFDADGDLAIALGDLACRDATEQHTTDLLLATKGSFRQHPLVGVGIVQELLNSTTPDEVRTRIQTELERDGQRITRIASQGASIEIDSYYV